LEVKFGTGVFDRDRGNLPKIPVINMYAEQTDIEGLVMQSRPGLTDSGTTLGAGPVKGLFHIDGVLSGQTFAVSAGHLYANSTDLGAINGTGHVSMAGLQNFVFACAGQSVYSYNGAALAAVAMPGGFDVTSICVGSDRLIVIDKDTGHFYWSNVLTSVVDPLNFATAENSPDKLKECLFLGDTLLLFGTETVEQWPASSANPDLPFSPLVGRTFQVGIRDTGCATLFGNTFAWITSRNQICAGDANTVISTPSLDEKLSQSATASVWTFTLEGSQFLAVRLDTSTWVFSTSNSQWSEFQSFGQTNWIPQCYANGKFGSAIDGRLVQWGTDHSDFSSILERRLGAGAAVTSGTVAVNSLIIRTNPGQTPFLSGTYANPTIEIRTSRDGGFTWGNWKRKSLGVNGEYNRSIRWRSLGYFGYPAFLMQVRVTDPVPFRLSGIVANEDYATI
jgi:hypothetical protein